MLPPRVQVAAFTGACTIREPGQVRPVFFGTARTRSALDLLRVTTRPRASIHRRMNSPAT